MKNNELTFNDMLLQFMKEFDCEIVDETNCDENIIKKLHTNDYEVKDNILYLWRLSHDHYYDSDICEELKINPRIDTLYIGKDVTEFGDMRQIHYIMKTSYNIIPAFKNILLEDTQKYECIEGTLIDKKRHVVIAYASGLTADSIYIPDGILGFEEHCFNYNKYIRYLILPSSIEDIKGIVNLPNLELVVIRGNGEGSYYTENGIIFVSNQKQPLFIPPFNPHYPTTETLHNLLDRLLVLIRNEAGKRRWMDVDADCFSYDNKFKRFEGIILTYNGGFYLQSWTINLDKLPTRIMIKYMFHDEWFYWGDCCKLDYPYDDDYDLYDMHLRCSKCKHKSDCDAVYDSNRRYVENLLKQLNEEVSHDFHTDEGKDIECNLNIETSFSEVQRILLAFLDIALDARTRYPILNKPLKKSLLKNSELKEFQNSSSRDDYPFCFSLTDNPIGFCH